MSSRNVPASPPTQWRKSSHSNAGNQCVEVARIAAGIAVRDSKNPDSGHLTISPTGWQTFLDGVKRGDYSEPNSL